MLNFVSIFLDEKSAPAQMSNRGSSPYDFYVMALSTCMLFSAGRHGCHINAKFLDANDKSHL